MSEHKIYVAIVDDDDSFARALGRRLRAAGFAAAIYNSAEAFLQAGSEPTPDCLVLDIHLGGMSGLELCQRLTRSGRKVPVIFVTAHDEAEVREQAQRIGCSAYLRKPVPGKLLIAAITSVAGSESP